MRIISISIPFNNKPIIRGYLLNNKLTIIRLILLHLTKSWETKLTVTGSSKQKESFNL